MVTPSGNGKDTVLHLDMPKNVWSKSTLRT